MARLPICFVLFPMAALAGAGCGADRDRHGPSERFHLPEATTTQVDPLLPSIAASPALAVAADPKMESFESWPLIFDASAGGYAGVSCRIVLTRDATVIAELDGALGGGTCVAAWNGRDAAGHPLEPGVVDVQASLVDGEAASAEPLATATARIEVVRLGIDQLSVDAVEPGHEVALLYAATGGVRRSYYELDTARPSLRLHADPSEGTSATALELADGSPRAVPAPWTDLRTPPMDTAASDGAEHDTYNLPTAWVAGTHVAIAAELSADVAGSPGAGAGAPTWAEIRLVAPEGVALDGSDGTFEHGAVIHAHTNGSPAPAVGKYDVDWRWTFEARAPGGEWAPIPGAITTRLRMYGLAGAPLFSRTELPHRAWVEVVDLVTGWVAGGTSEPADVAGLIVEHVYNDLGLRYDDESGASAYTSYPSGWGGARFSVSYFQDRAYGRIINCSDAASIVSTYGNMVGVDLRYHILQHRTDSGFDLNYIQAIGFTSFTETPFTGGRGGFSYHAVTGPPDGTFYDATLALDGDGTPTSLPVSFLLAKGMMPRDYLFDLSSEWSDIMTSMDEKVVLR